MSGASWWNTFPRKSASVAAKQCFREKPLKRFAASFTTRLLRELSPWMSSHWHDQHPRGEAAGWRGGRERVLVGNGAGVLLVETAGKNLIIGGTSGAATLQSGSGQDIVIAGNTFYDNDQAALLAIENCGLPTSGTFAQRVAHCR